MLYPLPHAAFDKNVSDSEILEAPETSGVMAFSFYGIYSETLLLRNILFYQNKSWEGTLETNLIAVQLVSTQGICACFY